MNTAVAEKAVIGIMLIEPDRQSEAFKSLTAQMFSIKDLGDIFLLCKELDRRGERADAVSIISRCKENIKAIAYECAQTVPYLQRERKDGQRVHNEQGIVRQTQRHGFRIPGFG